MKIHKSLTTIAAAGMIAAGAATFWLSASAHAATLVNVNFGTAQVESTLVGPAGGSGTSWNQAGSAKSDTDVVDSAGDATTIDWAFSGPNFTNSSAWPKVTTNSMLESAFFTTDNNVRTLTISSLNDSSTYNVYIASYDQDNWGDGPMSFTTPNTTTSTTPQAAANVVDDGMNWVLNDNYVVFENVQTDGSGNILINGNKTSGSYGFWAGFQLVEITAVPEPTTVLLGSLGLLTLLRRRRA